MKTLRNFFGGLGLMLAMALIMVLIGPACASAEMVQSQSQYPQGATPWSYSASQANTAFSATLAAAQAGRTNYLAGLVVTCSGSTAGSQQALAVTGAVTGTLNFVVTFPVGVLVACTPLNLSFSPAIPASAPNIALGVTLGAGGSGNTAAAVTAYGYTL